MNKSKIVVEPIIHYKAKIRFVFPKFLDPFAIHLWDRQFLTIFSHKPLLQNDRDHSQPTTKRTILEWKGL